MVAGNHRVLGALPILSQDATRVSQDSQGPFQAGGLVQDPPELFLWETRGFLRAPGVVIPAQPGQAAAGLVQEVGGGWR